MSEDPPNQPPEAATGQVFELDEAMTIAAAQRILKFGDPAREAFYASEWEETTNETMLLREDLNKAKYSDGLTGLHNKRGLVNEVEPWIKDAESGDFGLLFVDLDRFKAVNDLMGHKRGDMFLRMYSNWLADFVRRVNGRQGDIVARLGGDEFGIAIRLDSSGAYGESELKPTERLDGFSIRLREGFEDFLHKHPAYKRIEVGQSIGGAIWEEGMKLEELIEIADKEMYANKPAKEARS